MITPSFNLTATERVLPKLALDFTTASLDPRITFARSLSTATLVNSSGYIETVAADTPRFDLDPITLDCKGLLIEESRVNSKTYSQAFSGVGWSSYQLARNDNVVGTLSPAGLGNAGSVIEDNNSGVHTFYPDNPFTSVIGTTYTISLFIKANGRSRFNLRVASTANPIVGTFLANGVFDVAAGTYVSGTNSGASIQAFADGWYRCSLSITATTTTVAYGISLISSGTTTNYTGDGVSGLYVWGAQFETGAFATSYIPNLTTGTTTRNADVVLMTGTNFSDWFNSSAGTFYIKSNARNGDTLLTAGAYTLSADATALKSYATTYGSDPSATQLEFGSGTVQRVMYYPHELIAAELAALSTY